MTGLMLKLNNFFSNGSNLLSSLFGADGDVVNTIDSTDLTVGALGVAANGLIDFILNLLYSTSTFVMAVLELMQLTFSRILGLTVDIKKYTLLDTTNPLIKILTDSNYTRVYRYMLGIAGLFVILFTIFSIIKSEYNFAVNDGPFVSKGRIFVRSLRSFFIMTIFPMVFLLVIVLSNAILAGFNDILKGDNARATIAGQIFVSSAYQANNYRNYADKDIRVPIVIDFNDPISLGQDAGYTTEQLARIYESFEERGKSLYNDFADFNFKSFTDTVSYRNNKVVNKSAFKGYEKFVCTAEQYYVMADFIDYAVKTNLTYYVKNIADADIDWGYVDEAIFNKEEGTLKIKYRDVNYLNDGDSYTITYAPESLDVSSPISDALDTISALLAIGKYGDNQFNTLKRLEDSINVVEWETDLAFFRFSGWFIDALDNVTTDAELLKLVNSSAEVYEDENGNGQYDVGESFIDKKNTGFYELGEEFEDIDGDGVRGPTEPFTDSGPFYTDDVYDYGVTESDKILFYEKYHFKYNNTFDYTLEDISNGVELPVYKLEKRHYQASTASYVVDDTFFVVPINGTYYQVVENHELRDDAGNVMVDSYNDYYYTFIADSSYKATLYEKEVEDTIEGNTFISYDKGVDAWKDMKVEKSNGTYEVVVPAEKFWDKDGGTAGVYDDGEEFEDANFNGVWDGQSTYITMYDDKLSVVIKNINWPQKLIQDLNTIYSGININQLIATNKWLSQLSEYVSGGNKPDETTGNIQTGLIHPLGLIMSEFFLGEISEPDIYNDYGSLKYSSKFDEKTIKALLLATMGEENYFQLDTELSNFCEIFNAYMGPVLDEIAYYENFELASGNEASIQLYTYKAYLASMLLSSSATKWMYDTAQLLIGNVKFLEEVENFDGSYKSYEYLFNNKCSDCFGSGYFKCTQSGCDPLEPKSDCTTCDGDGYLDTVCPTHKGYETAVYLVNNLYKVYKQVLKEQDVDERDRAYPEFMEALADYMKGGDAFKGRLDCVLSAWLSDTQREWISIQAYMELKSAYNAFVNATWANNNVDPDGDGVEEKVIDIINRNIYVPSATFVGIGEDGKTEYLMHKETTDIDGDGKIGYAFYLDKFEEGKLDSGNEGVYDLGIDEVKSLNDIYSFKSYGDDDFTGIEIASEVQEMLEEFNENSFKDLLHQNDIYEDCIVLFCPFHEDGEESKYSGFNDAYDHYIDRAKNYLNRKAEYLMEDNSYQFVGQRDKLQTKLNLQKVALTAAIAGHLIVKNPATAVAGAAAIGAGLAIDEISKIETREDWDKVKSGEYEFGFEIGALDLTFTLNPNEISALRNYIDTQDTIDRLNRYYITYGISSICQQTASTTMHVTVNNKAYTVGQNFTRAKFIEYVLGGEYLSERGYQLAFVDEDYQGLVHFDEYTKTISGFNTLYDFLVELGDMTAVTYQMTNFVNLSASSQDEIYIGSEFIGEQPTTDVNSDGVVNYLDSALILKARDLNKDGEIDLTDTSLANHILNFILDQDMLAGDLIGALFNIEVPTIEMAEDDVYSCTTGHISNFETSDPKEALRHIMMHNAKERVSLNQANSINGVYENERILNNVLSYLLLTETKPEKKNYVDYTKLTLKDFRLMCFDFLIEYEEQEGESVQQNQDRYLGVLKLACADWYTYDNPNTGEPFIDANHDGSYNLGEEFVDSNKDGDCDPEVETNSSVRYTAVNCSWTKNRKAFIKGMLTSNQSQATILRLAGLDNRPYEELVGAEYTINFDRDGVDEANGDVFIICTYDEERMLYIPFLMSNRTDYSSSEIKYWQKKHPAFPGEDKETWSKAYGHGGASTDYYVDPLMYPVVAKGVITADGRPTAIRQEGDDIVYYRDNIIIHDVSKTGLSTYYMSMDQVTVNYTATSFIANSISKLFTGKSLAENLITKIPKFAAHSDYNFCYGVTDEVKETSVEGSCSIDFNFKDEICISMENLYDKRDINILVLVIGVYTMTAALWKALWGATQRTIDIAMLYLIAPPIISTIALRGDSVDSKSKEIVEGSDDAYSRWKETLTQKILSIYGYAIGFNIFFILTPIIETVNLFETQAQLNQVVKNMSIFQGLSVHFVNELGRLVLLIASAYLSTRAVGLFASVLSISDAFKEGESTFTNVKNTVSEVGDHWSGQYAADKAAEAKNNMKAMIPGMAIGAAAVDKAKDFRDKHQKEWTEKSMIKAGVDASKAGELSKALQEKVDEKNKKDKEFKANKKEAREKRNKAREERGQT